MRSANLLRPFEFGAVTGLLPGKYDIYCYGWGGSLFGSRTVTFRVFAASGQINKSLSYTSVWPGQQVEGVTYVRVPIEVSPLNTGFSIELGGGPGVDPSNVLAGIQIVPVPAPGFVAVAGAGAVCAARRRRVID